MPAEDLAFLKDRVSLFASLPMDQVQKLGEGSWIEQFAPGERILHAGEEIHSLGIIMSGTITASTPADGHVLGQLQEAETFGDMSILTGEPAVADLTASVLTRVLFIPLTMVQSHIMKDPLAVAVLAKNFAARMRHVMSDPAKTAAFNRKEDVSGMLELKSARPESVLVLNLGSSSLKYTLFNTSKPEDFAHGKVERIGDKGTKLEQQSPKGKITRELPSAGHAEALQAMLAALTDPQSGVARDVSQITAVGHRVVHGGEKFTGSALIDDKVVAEIEKLGPLAPLHNPINAAGIRAARRILPGVPHVAVFDTAFHTTLPSDAYLYGLPYEYYEQHGIRRYGFHGPSHNYVSIAAAQFLQKRPRQLKIISCHLGNGASVCAIEHGRSVDVSMGFTPGEGLIMGTRCGDLDSGVLTFLAKSENLEPADLDTILNRKSGLLGISGISADMRDIEKAADQGHLRSLIALKTFGYRIRKYIGAYIAAMGGLDVLIFTAGIGQGSNGARAMALQGLHCMGIHLDETRNREAKGNEIARISADDSPVTVLVVPTDEERMIARETLRVLERDYLVNASEACHSQPIPIEISAHHIHLSQEHVEALFGPGHQLTKHADLSQPGQYACKEQVTIVGPKGRIERVRVLGPTRKATQVEIAMTEQFKLGIHPPIRESGDIEGSPGCTLEGPAGSIAIDRGVICALRHIHMTPEDALRYGLRDKCDVRLRIEGDREMIMGDVRIRVHPDFALAMHIDTDEANAGNLRPGAQGYIVGIQQEE